MSFKKEHPGYEGYESEEFYVNNLPDNFSSSLEGYIARYCCETSQLKEIVNDIAFRIPRALTGNWGSDYLMNDLSNYLYDLCKNAKFHKTMDFLSDFYERFKDEIDIGDFNELLGDLKLGYELECYPMGSSWTIRDNVTSRVGKVEQTSKEIKDICKQTLDHLEQAKQHIISPENSRDRKDAIRDCLSAMEAMLKTITGEKDIKPATSYMRKNKWGPDVILKDGLHIWDLLNQIHPDIRHGNPEESILTDEDALYWVERINCFISYVSKKYKKENKV